MSGITSPERSQFHATGWSSTASAMSVSGIAFYNYGHIALSALDRVREALAVLEESP